MIFNFQQIQDMLSILKRHELIFVANQIGSNYLSESDKAILLAAGIDVNKFKNKQGIIEHAFLFGMLADALGDSRAKRMDYNQFQRFLASGNFIPLTESEEFAVEQLKQRAYTDITNLGARMRNVVANAVLNSNQKQAEIVANTIKKHAVQAVQLRQGARMLAADLARTTKDFEVDWLRISYYLTHEAYNTGRAKSIEKEHGLDAEVYFDVYEKACSHCVELYLTDGVGSIPRIFKLGDLIKNGNNIGKKVEDWKPTIAPVHPYCRCTLTYKDPDYDWDSEMHAFVKPKKRKPKNPALNNIDIKSLIKIKR